jgi:hypothetical protein
MAALAVISRTDALNLWSDERWTVFHSSTLEQIIRDPDVNWPFGPFVVFHFWMGFATWNDFSLHMLGALCGIVATAILIQVGRQISSAYAGLLAGLVFATSAYVVYFTLEVRGYSMLLLSEAAFLWLYVIWLRKPALRRSALLFGIQTLMLYISFLPYTVLALSRLHTLVDAPRKFLRWLAIAAATGIVSLPMLPQLLLGIRLRGAALTPGRIPAYMLQGFDSFIRAFSAHWDLVFGFIIVLAGVGIGFALRRAHRLPHVRWKMIAWLALWGLGIPIVAYITKDRLGLFTTRYIYRAASFCVSDGIANRRAAGYGRGGYLIRVSALAPGDPTGHRYSPCPIFRELRTRAPGDVILVDPQCNCEDALTWEYYSACMRRWSACEPGHLSTAGFGMVRQAPGSPARQRCKGTADA